MRKTTFAQVALIFGTVAAIIVSISNKAQAATVYGPGDVTFREATDANDKPLYVLTLVGEIVYPIAKEFEDDINENFKDNRPLLIIMNSPGGSLQEGEKIIDLIQAEVAKGRKVSTSVENGSMCASMCVPLFVQGYKRYAGEGSLFMVHGASPGFSTNVPNFFSTEEYLSYLYKAGVSKDWLDGLKKQGVFSKPGAYWMSGKELFDQKLGVVTNTIPRWAQEPEWHSPIAEGMGPH